MRLFLLSLAISVTVHAQVESPLEDKFTLDSRMGFSKSNLKMQQDYLDSFESKFSKGRELQDKQFLVVQKLDDESKRIQSIAEKKRTKQEKEFLIISPCMKGFLKDGKSIGDSPFSAKSINQCFYTENVDPRHFRKTASGKLLGESVEIQKEGDPMSVLVDSLMNSNIGEEEWKKIKEYKAAKEYKDILETSSIAKAKNEIEILEKKIAARTKLDELIDRKLMNCETEMKLDSDSFKHQVTADYNAEVANDMFSSLTGNKDISELSLLTAAKGKVCPTFDSLKLQESLSIGSDINKLLKEDPLCMESHKDAKNLIGVYCDKSQTNNIIYNKDKVKALTDLRRIVITNLAQKLPVGIEKANKFSSVIGLKKDGGECKYLVKNYEKGRSEWISEKSILDGLQEINYLKRQ